MREIIFTENPLEALLLIQNDYPNTTFLFGDDHKYLKFINEHKVKRIIFTFEGKMRLFYELSKNGVSTKRVFIDFHKIKNAGAKEYFEKIFSGKGRGENTQSSDLIQEIENGFLFQLPHLNYRIIGNFSEYTMNMKANIKVYNQNDVFVDGNYAEQGGVKSYLEMIYVLCIRHSLVFSLLTYYKRREYEYECLLQKPKDAATTTRRSVGHTHRSFCKTIIERRALHAERMV